MSKQIKNVRLKDIAKITNVSVATVSIILNDPDTKRVSPEKRKEVVAVAKKMHYVPNVFAKGLVNSKTNTIGLIIPDLENPFFAKFAKNVESLARLNNHTVLIVNADNQHENDIKLLEFLYRRSVDAIILASSADSYGNEHAILDIINKIDVPVVIADRSLLGFDGTQIVFDNRLGVQKSTDHCINKGHTKIGLISTQNSSYNGFYRHQGYLDSLHNHEIEYDESLVFYGDFNFDTGYNAAPYLIEKGVSAVVAANDLIAFGFKKHAEQLGVNIPKDISLIGFDNLEINNFINDGITSINLDVDLLAQTTLDAVFKMMLDKDEIIRVVIEPDLVERESVIEYITE